MSATKPADAERLLTIVEPYLPEQPWLYDEDALTDRSDRFLAAEIVREKLFRLTGDELPYTSTVVIDKYEEEGKPAPHRRDHRRRARRPQGHDHRRRRRAAEAHRLAKRARSSSACSTRKVFLELWVKVRSRLGRRRSAPAPLRLRIAASARRAPARADMASRAARSTALAAYVLHRYDWSESSLILDLFTREQGRIAVAAKGAKRPFSQLRGVLLPFQRLQVSLGRQPAGDDAREVQTLRGADWAGGPPMLTGAALFSGFYLNELLMKLLARHDPHAALFDAYAGTVAALAGGDDAATPGGAARLRAGAAARDRPAARPRHRDRVASAGARRSALPRARRRRRRRDRRRERGDRQRRDALGAAGGARRTTWRRCSRSPPARSPSCGRCCARSFTIISALRSCARARS